MFKNHETKLRVIECITRALDEGRLVGNRLRSLSGRYYEVTGNEVGCALGQIAMEFGIAVRLDSQKLDPPTASYLYHITGLTNREQSAIMEVNDRLFRHDMPPECFKLPLSQRVVPLMEFLGRINVRRGTDRIRNVFGNVFAHEKIESFDGLKLNSLGPLANPYQLLKV